MVEETFWRLVLPLARRAATSDFGALCAIGLLVGGELLQCSSIRKRDWLLGFELRKVKNDGR